MGWDAILSNMVLGGFGEDVAEGIISNCLCKIPRSKCREYICQDKNLLEPVTEKQWKLIRKAVRVGSISVSYEHVVEELEKNRPDLLGIIMTTEGGIEWLQRQITEACEHLLDN